MKSRLIVILLILSLAINVAAGTVAIVKYFSMKSKECTGCEADEFTWVMKQHRFMIGDRNQFKEIRKRFRDERLKFKPEIARLRNEVVNEIIKTEPDINKINQLIDDISARQNELQKNIMRRIIELRSKMVPEKRKELDERIKLWLKKECPCSMNKKM